MIDSYPWHQFESLREIDIRNCGFSSFPLQLAQIPLPEKVEKFHFLEGNSFEGLSNHLALTYTTFPALVNALKEMSEGKEEKLRTIKLLVVGDAAVGKTTLLMSLRGRSFKQASTPLATDGIDLGQLTLGDTNFTCYDFAGQVLSLLFGNSIA